MLSISDPQNNKIPQFQYLTCCQMSMFDCFENNSTDFVFIYILKNIFGIGFAFFCWKKVSAVSPWTLVILSTLLCKSVAYESEIPTWKKNQLSWHTYGLWGRHSALGLVLGKNPLYTPMCVWVVDHQIFNSVGGFCDPPLSPPPGLSVMCLYPSRGLCPSLHPPMTSIHPSIARSFIIPFLALIPLPLHSLPPSLTRTSPLFALINFSVTLESKAYQILMVGGEVWESCTIGEVTGWVVGVGGLEWQDTETSRRQEVIQSQD